MNKRGGMMLWLVVISLVAAAFGGAAPRAAAAVEVTPTVRAAFDKTVTGADDKQKDELVRLYNRFLLLQQQEATREEQIKQLHYRNQEQLSVLRKQMSGIDAERISRLEAALKQTRDRHQPLFDQYQSLNRQITIASKLKNKDVTSFLRSQAAILKTAASVARQDIRLKESAVAQAKDERNKKLKRIRSTLSDMDPILIRIRAEQSSEGVYKKRVTAEWKYFAAVVKKADARGASASLGSLVSFAEKAGERGRKRHDLEQSISAIIAKAKQQLAESIS
jgi:hypothetical protein